MSMGRGILDRRGALVLLGALGFLVPSSAGAQVDPLGTDVVPIIERELLGTIGGWDDRPEYELTRVVAATILGSGEVVIAEQATREVRVYSPEGSFVRRMGGEGDGPGEFRSVMGVAPLHEDGLLVWDFARSRVTVFTATGEVEDGWSLEPQATGLMFAEFVGAMPDGRVVLRSTSSAMFLRDAEPGPRRDSVTFAVFGWGGDVEIGRRSVQGPGQLLYRDGSSWGTIRPLLGAELGAAVTHDGLVVGLSDSLHLRVLDGTGAWSSLIRVSRPTRPASRDVVESERAWRIGQVTERSERRGPPGFEGIRGELAQVEAERLKRLEHENTIPAFGELLAGSDGWLWVSDYMRPDSGVSDWFVWDGDENLVGRIRLPLHERFLAAGFGYVLTVEEDELGLQTVRIYGLPALRGRS